MTFRTRLQFRYDSSTSLEKNIIQMKSQMKITQGMFGMKRGWFLKLVHKIILDAISDWTQQQDATLS